MKYPARNVRVILADDHPIVLRGVADLLRSVPGFTVTAIAHSGAELIELLEATACDLVVTDFTMRQNSTDEDGLRLVDRLKRLYPTIPIVVFTMLTNGGILHRLCQAGVAGIASKDEKLETLGSVCQRSLVEQSTVLSPAIAERLARQGATLTEFRDPLHLSPCELEVVRMFSLGLSVTEIARRLNRSVPTIATQKRAAMRKLHVQTNVDLVRYATEQGFSG
ncbi:response regulator transcription factor [Paraburkholderia terricola]|nr:response regulator transcription factor [Paraburkholderia terricola]